MARGATLAARWLHEPQPISNQPVGLGFPHPAGRCRPGGSAFYFPGYWSCRGMEGFLIWGRELILRGCGGPRRWPKGQLSPPARSMSPSQSAITQWGRGCTPCGAVSTREICTYVPRLLELERYGKISDPAMGTFHPRGALALCTIPSQSAIGQ